MSRVFISYRPDDAPGQGGCSYDAFVREFGQDNVFMDVDDLAPGVDFVERLYDALRACRAMIVVIGPEWLGIRTRATPPLRDATDFVRREIRTAIDLGVQIVPVLVNGGAMPREVISAN